MAQHTPGPWKVAEKSLWSVRQSNPNDAYWLEVEVVRGTVYDARLIAAAPDLLAACEVAESVLIELIGADYDVTGELATIRAAIVKARGDD